MNKWGYIFVLVIAAILIVASFIWFKISLPCDTHSSGQRHIQRSTTQHDHCLA